jgi:hypothetical protein
MLIANMLVKLSCDDDRILFKAAVESITGVYDHILILTDLEKSMVELYDILKFSESNSRIFYTSPNFIEENGFAAARNILLEKVAVGDHVLWVDSDECHYPENLMEIKKILPGYDDVKTHFIHFTLSSMFYEKMEARINIFRKTEGTRWEGKVHEGIVHGSKPRILFNSDYLYGHFGYIRDQKVVGDRWKQYLALEGNNPNRIDDEYPDQQVLNHRKDELLPYFGEYPSSLPVEWIRSKMIEI